MKSPGSDTSSRAGRGRTRVFEPPEGPRRSPDVRGGRGSAGFHTAVLEAPGRRPRRVAEGRGPDGAEEGGLTPETGTRCHQRPQ